MVCVAAWIIALVLPSLFASPSTAAPPPPSSPPLPRHAPHVKRQDYAPPANRSEVIRQAFRLSWDAYYEFAFPNDELLPVSGGFGNSRNGWGASAVDALSTALLMREHAIVQQILAHIPTINWSNTNTTVSLFETTIRYLGGMLSGYDLLSGPLAHLADNQEQVEVLLTQSVYLAKNLSFAFNTPSGVPYNELNFSSRTPLAEPTTLATAGTLILEWTRLSDLTGDPSYAALVQTAEAYLLSPIPASSEPFPGLVGTSVSPTTGEFLDAQGGWTSSTDSFYEYLLKTWIYSAKRFTPLLERWKAAANSSIAFLASHPTARPDLTFLARYNNTTLLLDSQHLACFAPGSFLLAGQTLRDPDLTAFGLALVAGCRATYTATTTGIGPEAFGWDATRVPAGQESFFARNAFYILDAAYQLRPEVVESYYYAFRATRDDMYREWAWEAWEAIQGAARRGLAYSSVADVNAPGGGRALDLMESFWFAEVLKYLYLIFEDDAVGQVGGGGTEEWVLNTEGHPLRVFGK